MQTVTLAETQALAALADLFYPFLPGSGAKYTWREAAAQHDLEAFWVGGSKLPAITQLLEATFERRRDRFCDLLLTAVRQGMKYRVKKGEPVKREEVERLNVLVRRLGFGIPELLDKDFLDGLPSNPPPPQAEGVVARPRPGGGSPAGVGRGDGAAAAAVPGLARGAEHASQGVRLRLLPTTDLLLNFHSQAFGVAVQLHQVIAQAFDALANPDQLLLPALQSFGQGRQFGMALALRSWGPE